MPSLRTRLGTIVRAVAYPLIWVYAVYTYNPRLTGEAARKDRHATWFVRVNSASLLALIAMLGVWSLLPTGAPYYSQPSGQSGMGSPAATTTMGVKPASVPDFPAENVDLPKSDRPSPSASAPASPLTSASPVPSAPPTIPPPSRTIPSSPVVTTPPTSEPTSPPTDEPTTPPTDPTDEPTTPTTDPTLPVSEPTDVPEVVSSPADVTESAASNTTDIVEAAQ